MPYRRIDDPVKLRRILESILLIEADLDLPTLLRHVIEEARAMTGARYGALGVLNADRTELAEFLTSGLEPEQERLIGARPTGLGVLGLLISNPQTLHVANIGEHPERFGFPANHPSMRSFLGVPIKVRDEVYGNLYLTDKREGSEFTPDDQGLVEALALAAGIAIENARLHERVQRVAVLEDRDRLAKDLHDTVIQHLFAVGLSLQSLASSGAHLDVAEPLRRAVEQIDATIAQIRSTIYGLSVVEPNQGARSALLSLVHEHEVDEGLQIEVSFEGPLDTAVSEIVLPHLVAAAGEALSNVSRHAHASTAWVSVAVGDGRCTLSVTDDGRGMASPSDKPGGGLGLENLRQRAEKLGGALEVATPREGGAVVVWWVPLVR